MNRGSGLLLHPVSSVASDLGIWLPETTPLATLDTRGVLQTVQRPCAALFGPYSSTSPVRVLVSAPHCRVDHPSWYLAQSFAWRCTVADEDGQCCELQSIPHDLIWRAPDAIGKEEGHPGVAGRRGDGFVADEVGNADARASCALT
jgi:hypothetical protein